MEHKFSMLEAQAIRLKGPMGDALDKTIRNRLKKVDYPHLVSVFRLRKESDFLWRSEFWGKIVRSAIYAWRATGDKELLKIIKDTVSDILTTQTPDGCISSYPVELQLQGWDIWGRKYVLLGLTRYYNEIDADERVAKACAGIVDHLMTQIPIGGKPITGYGEHGGLAATSILGAIVKTYRITKDPRHLEYARWIASCGGSQKHNIFQAALKGLPPAEIGNGKAYELMSCFEGLAELYTVDRKPEYLQIVERFWELVRDNEIFITGVGGLKDAGGEYFFYGAMRQTHDDSGKLGETCVTTTWVRFCTAILMLTGRTDVADELERVLYNGVLGEMSPDGARWMHANPTPLAGACQKRAADDQINGFGEDCCLAQGPEAVASAPLTALLRNNTGFMVNCYEDLEAHLRLPSGEKGELKISGGYPRNGKVHLGLALEKPETFSISLRIPAWWSRQSELYVNGEKQTVEAGKYFCLNRCWNPGDRIELKFDLSLRMVDSPDLSRIAFMSGPLVLAQDSRLSPVNVPVPTDLHSKDVPVSQIPLNVYVAKELSDGSRLCDYASAGNLFACDNPLSVWLKKKE